MKKRWPVIFASVLAAVSLAALAHFVVKELRWKALEDSFDPSVELTNHNEPSLPQRPEVGSLVTIPPAPEEAEDMDAGIFLPIPEDVEDIDPGLSIPAPAENIDPDMDLSSNDDSDIIVVVPFDSAEADGTNSIIVAPDGESHCAA